MSKKAVRSGIFLALTLGASTALADPFGKKGEFALSGERLFGIYYVHASEQNNDSDSSTQISFFGQAPTLPVGASIGVANIGLVAVNPYSLPKVGFDYLITDGLTIGGSLIYAHTANTATRTVARGATVSTDYSGDSFVIAPRVGYAYMFSDTIGIWPRGGFMYHYQVVSDNNNNKVSLDGFALNIDAPFVFSLAEHFAILAGPGIDIGLSGTAKVTVPTPVGTATTSGDDVLTSFGLYAGLMGWI